MNFPSFDERLPFLNNFILTLVNDYDAGMINSWEALDEKVKAFFTSERMDEIEAFVPGWKKMASFSNGMTLTHVMCVFLGLFTMPEFQNLTAEQQQLAKWIVLFHDVTKIHIRGKRDLTHGFRSAALVGRALMNLGFPVEATSTCMIETWSEFTKSASTFSLDCGEDIQDNSKLPEIMAGIESIYGINSPATLIVEGVLLHMSLNVVINYPQAAPLSESEITEYINSNLMPLLKVMCLADNEGWTMFYPETRIVQREETLAAFSRYENLITTISMS